MGAHQEEENMEGIYIVKKEEKYTGFIMYETENTREYQCEPFYCIEKENLIKKADKLGVWPKQTEEKYWYYHVR